jgi:hypothetical protein
MTDSEGGDQPIAWMAIRARTSVISSDGQEVGVIQEVLASEEEDIFHGIVVRGGLSPHELMIPAENVTRITQRAVNTNLTADQILALPEYREEPSFHLGLKGLFRKHLGWVSEQKDDGPQ